jgi:hypothetical protein
MPSSAKLSISIPEDGFDERQMGVNMVRWLAPLLFSAFIIASITYAIVGMVHSNEDTKSVNGAPRDHGIAVNQLKFAQSMAVLFAAFLASGLGSKS